MKNKYIIQHVFENTVVQFPDSIAVDEDPRSMTYRELNECANRVACALYELGVSNHSVVGIYSEACIEYIVAVLGVLKAGAVFMPLNPSFPDKRIIRILEKIKPDVLITRNFLQNELSVKLHGTYSLNHADHMLVFEDAFQFNLKGLTDSALVPNGHDFSVLNPPLRTEPDSSCYIVTTSGSTGEPKAILGSMKGLTQFIQWEIAEFGLNQGVRASLLSHVTFDVSLRDIFVPLIAGGTLCIPDEETRHHPGKLFKWMKGNAITLTHIVPTLFRLLTREMDGRNKGEDMLPDLEYVLIAGEVLYGNDVISWRKVAGNHMQLVNIYGPSETTLAKFFYRITEDNLEVNKIVPIGKTIPDAEALIIKNEKLCSVDEIGEIYIKTPFMSKGYYNDPKLSETAFVQNPLVTDRADVVYKTGDLGKYRYDGNVRFVGRLDGQIKLHGNRVEIGEIEVVFRQHPLVRQAAVAAKADDFGNIRLVGYVVPESGETPSVESLRKFIGDRLPDYMVPAVFVVLKTLPLTHNGKIARKELPEPGRSRPMMEQAYIAPSSAIERSLSEVWAQVLSLDQVGLYDNFFDLGGTSILAVNLITVMKQKLSLEVSIVKLFQYTNISLLAKYLSQSQNDQPAYDKIQNRAQRRRAALSRKKQSAGKF